ncbi:DNA-directed RNA polymerase III subunit RPC9-like [Corticium candelabrum]|uniref:DNA-directed RNA polymerase III subunit RPC9-like n=1 Tax=Corticium candelabrum TaxID=121492 RepID=UPI002E25AEDD|nr:DNA-directed RNA polymerase III subunit RPC9-like [Corticium candelabrum]
MEVVNHNAGMLSNYEVYTLLQEAQAKIKGPNRRLENLATIAYETNKYLTDTSCTLQTPQIIKDFLTALHPFKLTRAEKLQLLNLRPTTAVEIHSIIEECEERLSEDQVDEVMKIVGDVLPGVAVEGEREGDECKEEEP